MSDAITFTDEILSVIKSGTPFSLKAAVPSTKQKYNSANIHPRSKARGFLRRGLNGKEV